LCLFKEFIAKIVFTKICFAWTWNMKLFHLFVLNDTFNILGSFSFNIIYLCENRIIDYYYEKRYQTLRSTHENKPKILIKQYSVSSAPLLVYLAFMSFWARCLLISFQFSVQSMSVHPRTYCWQYLVLTQKLNTVVNIYEINLKSLNIWSSK